MAKLQANLTKTTRPSNAIWQRPIYRFVVPAKTRGTQLAYKEVFVDVTRSVPSFDLVGKELSDTFDWALKFVGDKDAIVLDFGAGKLRNTLHLLNRGNAVTAVEFEKLSHSEQFKKNLARASSYGDKFDRLIFPHEFMQAKKKFDLIILVNVLSIMPVPSERNLVLRYCREKLDAEGMVLWFSQTTQSFYGDKDAFGDGLLGNASDMYKTFYKDYAPHEIDELFAASGMRLREKKTVPHVTARLYGVAGDNPLVLVLDAVKIREHVEGDVDYAKPNSVKPRILKGSLGKSQINVPNPLVLSAPVLYQDALRKLPSGMKHNHIYQNLVGAVFSRLFAPTLYDMQFERVFGEGVGKIDLVFRNAGDAGFFKSIRDSYQVKCPFVFVECKNLGTDLSSKDFNQMAGRFDPTHSHFGIIVCRRNGNRKQVLKHARAIRSNEENMAMWLEDADLLDLLMMIDDREQVMRIMEEKAASLDL